MDIINEISKWQSYITIALIVVVILLFIICIVLLKAIGKSEDKYRKFMRGVNGKNIEELVISYLDRVDESQRIALETKEKCDFIDQRLQGCFQKTSILRYKAFDNVGSDLSFSISLLDNYNNGFILTGIYGRNDSTTYAKPIDKGLSRYDLSEEEKEVLEKAINKS
ncbi:MAG: DUF4446 family protein [Clostridiaceae bacterium]|nr:DUF4446 family protein [Clostridiaceae bacterium]